MTSMHKVYRQRGKALHQSNCTLLVIDYKFSLRHAIESDDIKTKLPTLSRRPFARR